jgi:hypothetical protein
MVFFDSNTLNSERSVETIREPVSGANNASVDGDSPCGPSQIVSTCRSY